MTSTIDNAVMMVEDDASHADLFRLAWNDAEAPAHLTVVASGDEALSRLGVGSPGAPARTPRLILLDLNLPGLDGREVLGAIRADHHYEDVPIVIFSTSRSPDDIAQTTAAGADDYVVKPLRYVDLLTVVAGITERWLSTEPGEGDRT
ncbi:MAG: response regulator [Microthrixaceae bacterium]